MADPITAAGLAASIVQLIDATTKAYIYLNEVKHATKERAELAMEAANLVPLLTGLRNRVEKAGDDSEQNWINNIKKLGEPDGPLEQFQGIMLKLQSKLRPATGMKAVGKRLVWSFDKDEVKEYFSQIERFKSLIQLALQDDMMYCIISLKTRECKLMMTGIYRELSKTIQRE